VGFVSSFCVLCPVLPVSIFFGGVRLFFLCLVSNVTRVYLFWWSVCLLSVSCVQCSSCLSFLVRSVSSFCVLYPMLPVAIFFDGIRVFFLRLVPNVTRDYLFLVRYVSSFCVLYLMISVYIFLCLVSNVTRVYLFWWGSCLLSVSYVQCYPYLSFLVGSVFSFCVLCPMLPVSIFFDGVCVFFLCLVPNVLRVYLFWWGPCLLSVSSCAQCSPCLSFLVGSVSSFCVLCPMLPVFIFSDGVRVFFLCLVSNVTRVYLFWWGPSFLSVSCVQCYP
jgi:hypothetical protein